MLEKMLAKSDDKVHELLKKMEKHFINKTMTCRQLIDNTLELILESPKMNDLEKKVTSFGQQTNIDFDYMLDFHSYIYLY